MVDQVLDGRRGAPLALAAGQVMAAVDLSAQLLGPLAGSLGRPARERPDRVAPLATVEPVVYEERLAAAGIGGDAEPGSLGIVVPPHLGAGELGNDLFVSRTGCLSPMSVLPALTKRQRCEI